MKHFFIFLVFLPLISLAESTSRQSLRFALNWKPEPQFGGFYAAQFLGFYKNENLDVKILEGGSGTPTIQMLTFGSVDVAIVSAEEILISNAQNPKNQVLALFATYQTNPQVLITPTSRGIKSIEELLNQKGLVSAQLGLSYVKHLQKKYPKNLVKWVPYSGGIHGLVNEKNFAQQGFLTSEPLQAQRQGVSVTSFLISETGFNPYTTVMAVRKSDWEKNSKKLQAFVRATRLGWAAYLKDPETTNQRLVKMNSSLDLQFMNDSARAQKPLIESPQLGHMTLQRWQSLADSMKELGILSHSPPAEKQFINPAD